MFFFLNTKTGKHNEILFRNYYSEMQQDDQDYDSCCNRENDISILFVEKLDLNLDNCSMEEEAQGHSSNEDLHEEELKHKVLHD